MTARRPCVAVTRPEAGELEAALSRLGADPVAYPLLRIEPPADPAALDRALETKPELVAFTSRNAVGALLDRPGALAALARCRVAAVGSATAAELARRGVKVDVVPEQADAAGLAKALAAAMPLANRRVLLPLADRARRELPDALRAGGADVVEVVAYRTVSAPPATAESLERDLLAGALDAVTFGSPSAVESFAAAVGPDRARAALGRVSCAAIGATTAAALRDLGVAGVAIAARADAEGLARAALMRQHGGLDRPHSRS